MGYPENRVQCFPFWFNVKQTAGRETNAAIEASMVDFDH